MKKIRYKVVTKDRRSCKIDSGPCMLRYPVKSIVTAHPGTCGVLVFLRRCDAIDFIDSYCFPHEQKDLMIIEVLPIGRKQKVKTVHFTNILTAVTLEDAVDFINDFWDGSRPPAGTEAYTSVEVLT